MKLGAFTFLIFLASLSSSFADGKWNKLELGNQTTLQPTPADDAPVKAQMVYVSCSTPLEPFCLTFGSGKFDSDLDRDQCAESYEEFAEGLAEYNKCVIDETAKVAKEMRKKFNCRVAGNDFCY